MWRWDGWLYMSQEEWERNIQWGHAKGALSLLEDDEVPVLPYTGSTEFPATYYETVDALGIDPLNGRETG